MKTALSIAAIVLAIGCSRREAAVAPDAQPADARPPADTTAPAARIQPWTTAQQEQLLKRRLPVGMNGSMGQFANMFLVMSRIHLGCGVGLMTPSEEISKASLQSPFPASYEPTLRELLDTIALQTFSQWKYDPSSKYFDSNVEGEGLVHDLAIFEFTKAEREKPYEVTLAKGWKAADRGHWLMLVPPDFPVGMDIYEMGTYSADAEVDDQEFQHKIRREVALDFAQRARENVQPDEMKLTQVGPYEALFFESMVPSQVDKDVRWRQWVFMVDNKCYFIISTIFPELDDQIFPDVEKMVASFRIKKS